VSNIYEAGFIYVDFLKPFTYYLSLLQKKSPSKAIFLAYIKKKL